MLKQYFYQYPWNHLLPKQFFLKDQSYQVYVKIEKFPDSLEKFNALRSLLFNFNKSFPEENVLQQATKSGRVFIFGLELAGKTTLIKQLKNEDITVIPPTINVAVTKALLQDLCLIIYDAPGQTNLKDLWVPYLKRDLDGLVFVMDVVHRMKYPAAKEVLFDIATNRNLLTVPLLILFNKKDLFQPNIDILIQDLELNKFHGRPIKWFLTSALNGDNVQEAFLWLAEEISKKKR